MERSKDDRKRRYFVPGVGLVKKSKFYEHRKSVLMKEKDSMAASTSFHHHSADTYYGESSSSAPSTSVSIPLTDVESSKTSDDGNDAETYAHHDSNSSGDEVPDDFNEIEDDDSVLVEEEGRTFELFDDDEEDEPEEDADETSETETPPVMSVDELKAELALWISESRVTMRCSRSLLNILKRADPNSVFAQLPKDPRSLFQKEDIGDVPLPKPVGSGEYVYLGVKRALLSNNTLYDRDVAEIGLTFHVDGLPLFHSSPMKFWPILGCVGTGPAFLIALYKGLKDPPCPAEFMKDFIDEILPFLSNGIEIHGRKYVFELTCLLADAPARAFLLGMKLHSGFFSCSKCKIRGSRLEGRICFPFVGHAVKRSASDFYKDTDDPKDNSACPLSRIPLQKFDFVSKVVLNSMHMIYLGVVKRLKQTFLGKIAGYQSLMTASNVNAINERMAELQKYYPCEFQRAPRPLSLLAFWRAHEYRQFILYTMYAVMHDILSEDHLSLVLMLQIYCRLLSDKSKVSDEKVIEYCKRMAEIFIVRVCELFGNQWAVYNVHGLLHIPDDVFTFGQYLEEISCFKFESFLFFIKRLVRSGREPLKQAVNRYLEFNSASQTLMKFRDENTTSERKRDIIISRPDISSDDSEYTKYKRLTLSKYTFRSDREGDCCCLLEDQHFVEISFCARSKKDGQLFIAGRKYLNSNPLYDDPDSSSVVDVYRCSRLESDVKFYPLDEITEGTLKKVYRLPLFGTNDIVCSTLLH